MKYIKPPALSTSFSESGKNAEKRFANILDLSKKKKGVFGFLFVLSIAAIGGVIISGGNHTNAENEEDIAALERIAGKSYSAVLMDIESREVITQISAPKNEIGNMAYEPGPAFGMITLAVALEENAVSLSDEYICSGSVNIGGHTISCGKKEGHGHQTVAEGAADFCSPILAEMAKKTGKEKFYAYMRKLGLADVDANGAIFFQKQNFGELELAISGTGQGFRVIPMQMARAFSAVLNGGDVISKKTAEQVKEVLAQSANIKNVSGIAVGMINSAAEKLPRGAGKYTYSAIAFAPLDHPRVICISVVDESESEEDPAAVATAAIREYFQNRK